MFLKFVFEFGLRNLNMIINKFDMKSIDNNNKKMMNEFECNERVTNSCHWQGRFLTPSRYVPN